jgi:hypothetical protein
MPTTPVETVEAAGAQSRTGVAELIWTAQTSPPKPVIQGLLNESEIAGLHGAPEVFKTIFSLQIVEALASAPRSAAHNSHGKVSAVLLAGS